MSKVIGVNIAFYVDGEQPPPEWRYGFGIRAKAHWWPDLERSLCGMQDGTMDVPSDDPSDYCKNCVRLLARSKAL